MNDYQKDKSGTTHRTQQQQQRRAHMPADGAPTTETRPPHHQHHHQQQQAPPLSPKHHRNEEIEKMEKQVLRKLTQELPAPATAAPSSSRHPGSSSVRARSPQMAKRSSSSTRVSLTSTAGHDAAAAARTSHVSSPPLSPSASSLKTRQSPFLHSHSGGGGGEAVVVSGLHVNRTDSQEWGDYTSAPVISSESSSLALGSYRTILGSKTDIVTEFDPIASEPAFKV